MKSLNPQEKILFHSGGSKILFFSTAKIPFSVHTIWPTGPWGASTEEKENNFRIHFKEEKKSATWICSRTFCAIRSLEFSFCPSSPLTSCHGWETALNANRKVPRPRSYNALCALFIQSIPLGIIDVSFRLYRLLTERAGEGERKLSFPTECFLRLTAFLEGCGFLKSWEWKRTINKQIASNQWIP